MEDLIKQLNNLPKAKLSKKRDFSIRLSLYSMLWQRQKENVIASFQLKRLKPVMAAVVVLLIMIMSVPAYAYSSSQVTQGHILYPIKKGIETFEISLAQSDAAKVEKYVKMAERRLEEAETLSKKDDSETAIINTVNEAMDNSFEADLGLENIFSEKEMEKMEKMVDKARADQEAILSTIAQNVGIAAEESVIDSVALALESNKKKEKDNKNDLNWGQAKKYINNFPESEDLGDIDVSLEEAGDITQEIEDDTDTGSQNQVEAEQEKIEQRNYNREIAEQSLGQLKNQIAELKTQLPPEDYETEDVSALFEKLDKKIEKAEEFMAEDKLNGFQGAVNSANAISNNAKYFIKPKKEKKNKKNNSYNAEDSEGQYGDENNVGNFHGNSNKSNKNKNK